MSRTESISDVIKHKEKETSKWIKTKSLNYGTMLSKFNWQVGYGFFSVSASQKEKVVDYIKGQKEHHKAVSFKDELRVFYRKHEVEYNECYVWD